mgnify:CR=1 FL=1
MAAAVPPMTGAEYLTAGVLAELWRGMDAAFDAELSGGRTLPRRTSSRAGIPPGTRRPRALQSGREPQGRGRAVRFPGDLHHAAFEGGQGTASAARQRRCRNTAGSRNRERLLSLLMPVQRAAETLRLAQAPWSMAGDNLPPAALEPRTGAPIPEGRAGARKRRRGRAHAGELAHEPSGSPPGEGHGRRQGAVAPGDRCAARLPDGGDARRRKRSSTAEIKRLLAHSDGLGLDPRQVGRGRS